MLIQKCSNLKSKKHFQYFCSGHVEHVEQLNMFNMKKLVPNLEAFNIEYIFFALIPLWYYNLKLIYSEVTIEELSCPWGGWEEITHMAAQCSSAQ